MSFDKTNTAHLIALRDEEANDPLGMGYSTANGVTVKTLDFFNNTLKNVGLEETAETLTSNLLLASIEPDDLTIDVSKFTQGKSDWLAMLLAASEGLTANLSVNRDKILELFNENPQTTTYNNLVALQRRISRVEALFGLGTRIAKADWVVARDYIGV